MKRLLLLCFTFFTYLEAMSLDDTILYALEHNNIIKQANISTKRSKSMSEATQAQKFGKIDALASYDHYSNARTLTSLTPMSISSSPDGSYKIPTTQNMFSVGIAYNVMLFDGFMQQNTYKISDLQYRVSAIEGLLEREELIYNVKNIYLSLLASQERLDAQQLYTKSQMRLLDKISQEFKLGSKSRIDYLKAKNSLTESELQEVTLETNIDILKATLSSLMGGKTFDRTEDVEINIDEKLSLEEKTHKLNSLKRYKATELDVQANERKIDQAKAAYYPKIDFRASYAQVFGPNDTTNTVPLTSTAPTAGETLIEEGEYNSEEDYQIGLHLTWNIFDFGETSALTEEARLSYMQSKLKSKNVEIELRKEIITAQNKIKLAAEEHKYSRIQYELLSETYKMELVSYENDALSLTDLLDTSAKKELSNAQVIDAKYSYQIANYYLDYLLEKGDVK